MSGNWTEEHWRDVCKMMAVAYRDRHTVCWFDGNADARIVGYADASYAGESSRGCYVLMYMGGFVEIGSTRLPQKYMSSTFAVEAKQAATGTVKVQGLQALNLAIPGGERASIPLLCGDNKGVHSVATKPGSLAQVVRHQVKDFALLRDCIARLLIMYAWISTKNMVADIGTKFPTQAVYEKLVPILRGDQVHADRPKMKRQPRERKRKRVRFNG